MLIYIMKVIIGGLLISIPMFTIFGAVYAFMNNKTNETIKGLIYTCLIVASYGVIFAVVYFAFNLNILEIIFGNS